MHNPLMKFRIIPNQLKQWAKETAGKVKKALRLAGHEIVDRGADI